MSPLPFAFLNLGGTELLVIMAIVLILFGGDKLPDFAKGLGKTMREFKKATSGVEEEIRRAMDEPPTPPRPPTPVPVSAHNPAPVSTVQVTTTTAHPDIPSDHGQGTAPGQSPAPGAPVPPPAPPAQS